MAALSLRACKTKEFKPPHNDLLCYLLTHFIASKKVEKVLSVAKCSAAALRAAQDSAVLT